MPSDTGHLLPVFLRHRFVVSIQVFFFCLCLFTSRRSQRKRPTTPSARTSASGAAAPSTRPAATSRLAEGDDCDTAFLERAGVGGALTSSLGGGVKLLFSDASAPLPTSAHAPTQTPARTLCYFLWLRACSPFARSHHFHPSYYDCSSPLSSSAPPSSLPVTQRDLLLFHVRLFEAGTRSSCLCLPSSLSFISRHPLLIHSHSCVSPPP